MADLEQLQNQLNYVRGKLNAQKEEITQLEAARDYWRKKYLNGGTGIALAVLQRTAFIDSEMTSMSRLQPADYELKVKHEVLAATCLQLHEVLKPGGKYNLRVSEETLREVETYPWDPGTRYKVVIHVWEDGAHDTTDTNARE